MIFVFYKKDGVLRRIIIFPTIKTPEKGVTLVTLVTQGERTWDLFGGGGGTLGGENGEKSWILLWSQLLARDANN